MTSLAQPTCDYAACTQPATHVAGRWTFCSGHATDAQEDHGDQPLRLAVAAGEHDQAPVVDLPVRLLQAHPDNVRIDLGDLTELEDTIREHGVIQALTITHTDNGYLVIDGHRRLAAAINVGLPRVPVTQRGETNVHSAIELMLVTGLHKRTLDPIEEARAYQRLINAGRTQAQIARAVGKNQGQVSQRLALLNLTPTEQEAIRNKQITIDAGYKAGRDLSDRRMPGPQKRPKPKRVFHFNGTHPLARAAGQACTHEVLLKLGPACGPCWENAIRADALNTGSEQAPPLSPDAVEATTSIPLPSTSHAEGMSA